MAIFMRGHGSKREDGFCLCRPFPRKLTKRQRKRQNMIIADSLFELAMQLEGEREAEIEARRHGNTKLYQAYRNMLVRCDPKNADKHPCYAGRGIKVCDEWRKSFDAFRNWALENGFDGSGGRQMSIDRIDNNGDYSPDNCRWTNVKTQSRNRRSTVIYPYNGKELTQTEFCEEACVTIGTVYHLRKKGLSPKEIADKFSH